MNKYWWFLDENKLSWQVPLVDHLRNLPLLQDRGIWAVEIAVLQGGLVVGKFQTRGIVLVGTAQNETEAGAVVSGVGVAAAHDIGGVVDHLEEIDVHKLALRKADIVAGRGAIEVNNDLWLINVLVRGCGAARVGCIDAQRAVGQQACAELQAGIGVIAGIACQLQPVADKLIGSRARNVSELWWSEPEQP